VFAIVPKALHGQSLRELRSSQLAHDIRPLSYLMN
jgi:hypothetical protein